MGGRATLVGAELEARARARARGGGLMIQSRSSRPEPDPRVILETANEHMRLAVDRIGIAARVGNAAIIYGETGTGKELAACCIHLLGARAAGRFVPVNCAAIPAELIDRELFGHVRGAFTGADKGAPGLIRAADGGTLFLDEIAELPFGLQPKLLRVIEDGRVRPLGGTREEQVDVRFIASYSGLLSDAGGRLRRDLLMRLNRIPILLPPLRDRREDIPRLAARFLERSNRAFGRNVERISPRAMRILRAYAWPGNIRELENVIEQAILLGKPGSVLMPVHLPPLPDAPPPASTSASGPPLTLREAERRAVASAMRAARGNKAEAARILGIARGRLYALLAKHAMARGSY